MFKITKENVITSISNRSDLKDNSIILKTQDKTQPSSPFDFIDAKSVDNSEQRSSRILYKIKETNKLFFPNKCINELISKMTNLERESQITEKIDNSTIQEINNSSEKEKKLEIELTPAKKNSTGIFCPKCQKWLSTNQGLGGHMSRKHAGLSKKYQLSQEIRNKRLKDRIKLHISKVKFFERINHNYYDLKKSKEGKFQIRKLLNRFEIKKIKQEITEQEINDFYYSNKCKEV